MANDQTDVPRKRAQLGAFGILFPYGADDRIILVRARRHPTWEREPQWSLPGGYIEPGDLARDTFLKEAREETGKPVKISRWLGTLVFRKSYHHIHWFEARLQRPLDNMMYGEIESIREMPLCYESVIQVYREGLYLPSLAMIYRYMQIRADYNNVITLPREDYVLPDF